ncbi:MAG: FAD-dependent oxidoreductase [Planctomycetota bacterium]
MTATKDDVRTDCLIVGGGLAGLATAFSLTELGVRDVVVVEAEIRSGVHASGRSAAMIRQINCGREITEFSRRGCELWQRRLETWGASDVFTPRGSLLLGGEALHRDASVARELGVATEQISPADARERVPALAASDFDLAIWTPGDGTVDASRLISVLSRAADEGGAQIRLEQRLTHLEQRAGGFEGRTHQGVRIVAQRVINAAGAWAGEVGRLLGAAPVPIRPLRRHMLRTGAAAIDPSWPFVWNVASGAYFRPEGDRLLLCACDDAELPPHDAQPTADGIRALREKVSAVFPSLPAPVSEFEWAGLRTFSQSERFVIGPDPVVDGFFWVAGLGGHGVTTSPAVGDHAAQLVAKPELDTENPFSPRLSLKNEAEAPNPGVSPGQSGELLPSLS